MKSMFCAYASRVRLVNPENISTIHQSHPTSISTKYGFHHKTGRLWVIVSTHFTTHFNEKTLNLFENDDPKSTSFMMKSIFCAYTSRVRLVDC